MFFRKPLRGKGTKTKVLRGQFVGGIDSVTEELLLSQKVSKASFNVSGISGALKHCGGFSDFDFHGKNFKADKPIEKIWFLKNNSVFHAVALMQKRLYFLDLNAETGTEHWQEVLGSVEFSSNPQAVSYKLNDTEILIFSSISDGMYYYDGTLFEVPDAPKLTSMAVHYERLFGVSGDDNILWFSDDLNPTNWNISLNEAGFLEFADEKGKLLKVTSYLDYLYIFRENGITRISAYAEQEDFNVTQLFVSSGRIFGSTAETCGDVILFLSEDGLFSFNGSSAKRIFQNLDGLLSGVDNKNAYACFAKGRYLLALKMNFDDDRKIGCEEGEFCNNVLFSFNLYSGEQNLFRGVDISFLNRSPDNNAVLCFFNEHQNRVGKISDSGCCFSLSMEKSWATGKTDFGSSLAYKILNYVVIYTQHDLKLTVETEEQSCTFEVEGRRDAQKIPLNIKGKTFSFCYTTDCKQMHVVEPKFVYTVLGGEL